MHDLIFDKTILRVSLLQFHRSSIIPILFFVGDRLRPCSGEIIVLSFAQYLVSISIPPKNISCVNFLFNVIKTRIISISNDCMALIFKIL